jgi:hypothetical protein
VTAPIERSGPMTPWGKPALGRKTRNKKKRSSDLIRAPSQPGLEIITLLLTENYGSFTEKGAICRRPPDGKNRKTQRPGQ